MSYSTMNGPLFDHRRGDIMRAYLIESERDIAQEGVDIVRHLGQSSFRYESSVPTYDWNRSVGTARTWGGHIVRDTVVYGPWLEGVSERNRNTRFKGYATFRRAAQLLGTEAHLIAQRSLPLYLKMLGGR